MSHVAMEATLFKFEPKPPQRNPFKQEPPTRAAFHVPILLYNKKNFRAFGSFMGEEFPQPPLLQRWFTRKGRPEVPVRVRRSIVQGRRKSTNKQATAASTTDKGIINLSVIIPESVTFKS